MSLQFNSDKQTIQGTTPKVVGTTEFTVRSGQGSNQKEVLRMQLSDTNLPRVGVNRTGERVEKINVTAGGSLYSTEPSVTLSAPDRSDGVQALASSVINQLTGQVTFIIVDEPGSGYDTPPTVTITAQQGDNGVGATATAELDTVEYELDVNGAVRTSTSIISDTARVLNLDIDNFVTPDVNMRAPNLKTFANNTGTEFVGNVIVNIDDGTPYRYYLDNVYQALNTGTTSSIPPTHTDGIVTNGEVQFKHIGFRVDRPSESFYGTSGESGIFPRSITPLQGDRSDKIATTEYVLNLATNDVGGRIYVSETIGSDDNDGRSAVAPVRTIKKACQLAQATVGVKETVIIAGGEYREDNPISIPPDCSIVGDNLRLVIIRPRNANKHMFKVADKNYIFGITFRDEVDNNGDPEFTWNYAVVFDDKQRIYYDPNSGGDFNRDFPIGYQFKGQNKVSVPFTSNTGLSALVAGLDLFGTNSFARGTITSVVFNTTTGTTAYQSGTLEALVKTQDAFNDIEPVDYYVPTYFTPTNATYDPATGVSVITVNNHGFANGDKIKLAKESLVFTCSLDNNATEHAYPRNTDPAYDVWLGISNVTTNTFEIQVGTSTDLSTHTFVRAETNAVAYAAAIYEFTTGKVVSIRAEGEVTSHYDTPTLSYPITEIDGSLQGTFTDGFQSDIYGNSEDLGGIVFYTSTLLPGRTGFHEFKEGEEITISGLTGNLSPLNGKQRIYKVIRDDDGRSRRFVIPKKIPTFTGTSQPTGVTAVGYTKHVTMTLLNSPNKFSLPQPVERRFQDACNLIRNNTDFIADEVVKQINDEFAQKYFTVSNVNGANQSFDVYTSPNDFVHTYVNGGTVTFNGNDYVVNGLTYNNVTGVGTITTATNPGLTDGDTVKIEGLVVSCTQGTKIYPGFNIPNGDSKCYRDVKHYLNAIIMDLEFGGNYNVIEAAERYVEATQIGYVDNQIAETVRAYELARQLAIFAVRNWITGDGTAQNPTYVPKYSTIPLFTDSTIITTTATQNADGTASDGSVCADVVSAIDTLAYTFADVLTNDATGTYLDAAYLTARNIEVIADEALLLAEAQYPSLSLNPQLRFKCKRDVKLTLRGLRRDLVLGGNAGIVTAAESYFTGNSLTGISSSELAPTLFAYEKARDLTIQAIRNWTDGTAIGVTPTNATYNSTTGSLSVSFPDPATPVTNTDKIAFQEGALTFSCTSNGGGNLASPTDRDRNYGKSIAISSVVSSGGITTIQCNVGDAGSATGVAHTFVSALAGATVIIYDPVTVANSEVPQFEDWNIALYATTPLCANVASTITTAFALFEDILDGTIAPGATNKTYGTLKVIEPTYPDGVISDNDGNFITPRAFYDDLPIIEASPYIQNSSIISFAGGSGCEVDGSKIQTPNSPKAGLEEDPANPSGPPRASFPNQGKSMVASAFTIVSFNGTGYRIINDGYTQLVSVFVIFCADGVLAESGGYASITNSATNFGIYALRAIGYREDPYDFDIGSISNVSSTPTGLTIFTISGLGRPPLEHYVIKLPDYDNTNSDIEYFIESVDPNSVSVSAPFSATVTVNAQMLLTRKSDGQAAPISTAELSGKVINLHRPSIVNSSSHTWEFAGAGTDYNALPENGGTKIEANEQVSQSYGRVYVSGTDELGDFKVGTFAKIENRTGAITFTGTVEISEVEFLKLKGGDVVVTGFDASATLGGAFATDEKLPTQKAVRDYITNNLGQYINKPYSTNAVPRSLVELTDSGKISIDQIPALRPFDVYSVADQAERLALEGALAGDIAIQQDTQTSFILNNDNDSLFLAYATDTTTDFNVNDIVTGSGTNGQLQITEHRKGVVYQINISNPGAGYQSPPTITITGGNPGAGSVAANAVATIANGQITTIVLTDFGGYIGGKGYTTQPTVNISAPGTGGTQAVASALIESRVYGDIVNNVKIEDTDTVQSSDVPSVTVTLTRVINTSSNDDGNWISLTAQSININDLTATAGNVISSSLLGTGSANSFTFLRGDTTYAPAVQSIKGTEERYFEITNSAASSSDQVLRFDTTGNPLIGHDVVNNVAGIPANTTVTGVTTAGGITSVSISNPLTAAIPSGTVIEFGRPVSPLLFDSNQTQGAFVSEIVVQNGGTGFSQDGQFFNIQIQGGSGNDLFANFTITGGTITDVEVTNSGSGYTQDFAVTSAPVALPTGSSNVNLLVKINTTPKYYANVGLDIRRVDQVTDSTNPYGKSGIARFKKDQFNIGVDGDGSVELKTGSGSGLDADKLDNEEGAYYLNATNLDAGTVPVDRLSGTYRISITGTAEGGADRLTTLTTNSGSSPVPSDFAEGTTSATRDNTADGLNVAGSKHLVLTLRNGGASTDASYGGVRQLAFADDNNMYIRGSGSGVSSFGSWHEVWSTNNHGSGSGLDADRLDGRQGTWYRNALNINYGVISQNHLPNFQESKQFEDSITVREISGQPVYNIYISGQTLTTAPFLATSNINLYNSLDQNVGNLTINSVTVNNVTDNTEDYTILNVVLTSGGFTAQGGAVRVGTTAVSVLFDDYWLDVTGTYQVAKIESAAGGTARMILGRNNGVATDPSIYFRSSALAASNYNAAIVASGGNASDGSGGLNVIVSGPNSLTVNSNVIWNAGNISFASANTPNAAVQRDSSGDFSAGTITASLSGAASANVLKSGDTMTGTLNITGGSSNLTVAGTTGLTGIVTMSNDLNVDSGTLFVDASSDNVGIGTTGPNSSSKLHIFSPSRPSGEITPLLRLETTRSDFGTAPGGASIMFKNQDGNNLTNEGYIEAVTVNDTDFGDNDEANTSFRFRMTNGGTLRTNMIITGDGRLGINTENPGSYELYVAGQAYVSDTLLVQNSITIDTDNDNSGAPLIFRGSSNHRNFRIGNQLVANNLFTIQGSTTGGGTTWNGTSAIAINGSNNRVGINTNNPQFTLDVNGDVNFTGTITQGGQTLTSSNWTKSGSDIYRISKVGINTSNVLYTLDVDGDINLSGVQRVNGDPLWLDTYGIIKVTRNVLAENVTIPAGTSASSNGPLTIASGNSVTVEPGGSWTII